MERNKNELIFEQVKKCRLVNQTGFRVPYWKHTVIDFPNHQAFHCLFGSNLYECNSELLLC